MSRRQLAHIIDSTLIKPTATKNEIIKLCTEAKKHEFCCAVVNPYYVPLAHHILKTSTTKVCSTVGFPLGATLTETKAKETQKLVKLGAQELDMVINISALKSKEHKTVQQDIQAVVTTAKHQNPNTTIKAIIETNLLTNTEKTKACQLAKQAKADYVKTSTGLFGEGATVKDIKLMRKAVGNEMGIKAAGGIRTLKDTLAMIQAGANRIGTSTAQKIIEEMPKDKN